MQTLLNSLTENTNDNQLNVADQAVTNHVKAVIKSTTSQDLSEEELDEILRYADDIGKLELEFRDVATSRDVLLRVMDKIFHQKKLAFFAKVAPLEAKIQQAAAKLLKLSGNKDPQELYKFMLNDNGSYIRRIGSTYWKKYYELYDKTTDETGAPLQFRTVENMDEASDEDIQYNIDLALAKRELAEWTGYQTITRKGNLKSGLNKKVADWFVKKRDKYEVWVPLGKNQGEWRKRKGVSERKYEEFKTKYFSRNKRYTSVIYKDGIPTGATVERRRDFLKPIVNGKVIIEFKDTNTDGTLLLDERYDKLMRPETALEEAQLEFYNVYTEIYEKMLDLIPIGQRNGMLGKIPRVANKLLMNIDQKKDITTKLFTKFSNGLSDFFTSTTEQRAVLTDENGDLVNQLPVYYTGSLKNEKKLKEIEDKINALQEQYKKGMNPDKYKKQIDILKGERKALRSRPSAKELDLDLGTNLIKFVQMATNFATMSEAEDTLNSMVKVIEQRKYNHSSQNTVLGKISNGIFKKEAVIKGEDSNVLARAKAFMSMIFYDEERINKTTLEKMADGVLQYTSLAYVGLNPFGSFYNYAFARVSNYIEVFGGNRFYSRKSYLRAEKEYNKYATGGFLNRLSTATKSLKRTSIYDPELPYNKYEAMVDFFYMMDENADLREQSAEFGKKSWFSRAMNFAYILQDIGEYNVQTKVGMAILMDQFIMNQETGEILSLYDAYSFDNKTQGLVMKKGFDTLVDKEGNNLKDKNGNDIAYDATYRANLRAEIRNVNKQIHGNYAKDDRMKIQAHTLGKFAAQFHKWVAPAINARWQREYYDENLGWMEGRYLSFMRYVKDVFYQINQGNLNFTSYNDKFKERYGFKGDGSQNDQKVMNRLQGFYRTTAELTVIGLVVMIKSLIEASLDSDDEEDELTGIQKKYRNILMYNVDRLDKDLLLFMPFAPTGAKQIMQLFKSPLASTRTLGEMGEAFEFTIMHPIAYLGSTEEEFLNNKDYVYQRGTRKGQYKLYKNWADIVPILYTIKKWQDFDQMSNFFIK